ncbi:MULTISPECIES: hypothetical protein [unclassified Ensifer]|uniref:hypothetical protein n=1 Tax=unclassified Ensifer TaxID=2633371 RepID=UPI0008135051|nr:MULTISPECIES: hypothetical protein [unclassified Ensifer]OCP16467.1 hypothetical protein BC361_11090 [Ensifer sp. LC54]OCP20340.1 hypothetical protein BC363_05805 [Ensifer sp. LC384]OCP36593.1 hypothetical protein BC360_04270 [Ensifer sp. LC163]
MNRISKLSIIAAFSSLTFVGIPSAQDAKMNWPAEIEQTVRDFKGENVTIVNVDTLSEQNQTRMWIDHGTAEQRAALQAAVNANSELAAKLKGQNVEMDNIAGAEQSADGSLTIYMR